MIYDVIVVGAGPAGSSTAFYLSKAGHKVLLLDKHHFPREKTCGDCVTPRGVRILEDMGAAAKLDGEAFVTKGVRIHSSRGGCSETDFTTSKGYPGRGLVVARSKLDSVLKDRAVEAGCRFMPGATVTGPLMEGGRIGGVSLRSDGRNREEHARFVVGADGGRSLLAKRVLGISGADARAVGVALRAYFEEVDTDDYMEILGEDTVLPGVGWLFPMAGGRANVGVGVHAGDLRKCGSITNFFRRFVQSSPPVRAKLARARQVGTVRGARLLMGGMRKPIAGDGLLLAGDAAALINPLTGEGMMYALESGRLAAGAIDSALKAGDLGRGVLSGYQKTIDSLFGRYFALGVRLTRLAKNPAVVNPSVNLLTKSRRLGEMNLRFWTSAF